jgi:hypothetical protein
VAHRVGGGAGVRAPVPARTRGERRGQRTQKRAVCGMSALGGARNAAGRWRRRRHGQLNVSPHGSGDGGGDGVGVGRTGWAGARGRCGAASTTAAAHSSLAIGSRCGAATAEQLLLASSGSAAAPAAGPRGAERCHGLLRCDAARLLGFDLPTPRCLCDKKTTKNNELLLSSMYVCYCAARWLLHMHPFALQPGTQKCSESQNGGDSPAKTVWPADQNSRK